MLVLEASSINFLGFPRSGDALLFTLDQYVLATLCSHLLTLFPAQSSPHVGYSTSLKLASLRRAILGHHRLPFHFWSLLLVTLFPSAGCAATFGTGSALPSDEYGSWRVGACRGTSAAPA